MTAGLPNLGNTCFISAALQFIFQFPFLNDIFTNAIDECEEIASSLINLYFDAFESELSIAPFDFIFKYREKYKLMSLQEM